MTESSFSRHDTTTKLAVHRWWSLQRATPRSIEAHQHPDGPGQSLPPEIAHSRDEPSAFQRLEHLMNGRRRYHKVFLNVTLSRREPESGQIANDELEVLALPLRGVTRSSGPLRSLMEAGDESILPGSEAQESAIRKMNVDAILISADDVTDAAAGQRLRK